MLADLNVVATSEVAVRKKRWHPWDVASRNMTGGAGFEPVRICAGSVPRGAFYKGAKNTDIYAQQHRCETSIVGSGLAFG